MELAKVSRNRLLRTFATWEVPKDFAMPMYNYLVFGYEPGGCFSNVLANDFYGAIRRSHPANTVEAFKALAGWICDVMPREAYGSHSAVNSWLRLTKDQRRAILEQHDLILTAEQETWSLLKGEHSVEPVLW